MRARIIKLTKSPTQSAKVQELWILEMLGTEKSKFKEPLMSRTSSADMANEVKLKFKSFESAMNFAKKHNYQVEVIEPKPLKISPKNYASNFK